MRDVSIVGLHRIRTGVRCCALLAISVVVPTTGFPASLNDTGITDCWNDDAVDNTTGIQADSGSHPRQDCRYGRDTAATGRLRGVFGVPSF
jgi:hypothetical protein